MKTLFDVLVVAIVCCGCSRAPAVGQKSGEIVEVVWDLSDNRSTTALNGGNWTPSKPDLPDYMYIYHLDAPDRFRLMLSNKDKYDFEDVTHVYAHRENGKILEIIVHKRGASLARAIDEAKQLHQQWKGEGLGDLSSWKQDVGRGSLQSYNTIIRDGRKTVEPAIWVNIHPDFNPPGEVWYVSIVYSWPRDATGKAKTKDVPSVRLEDKSQPVRSPTVVWDLSANRSTAALSGGNWTPSKPDLPDYFYIYHVKDIKRFCLVLEDGEKYEINGVADVFAHRTGDMISEVIVNARETSTDNAIAELKRMHERWKGEGLGDISSWRADISRGSLRRHNSLIRSLRSGAPLEVMASILTGFESEDSRFIQVSFSWPRLANGQEKQNSPSVGSKDKTRSERSSKTEWNLSNGGSPQALRGGKWIPVLQKPGNYIFVYEVERLDQFRLVLESGEQFEFDGVAHVSAPRRGKVVTQVAVQTQGMSLGEAIDEVSRMHERWKGKGLGDISAWQQDVARGSERGHDSLIRTSQTDGEPEIMASILKDHEYEDETWHIKVTFDWPKVGHADSDDMVKSEPSTDNSTGKN